MVINKLNKDSKYVLNYIYAHGKLEDDIGYDMVEVSNSADYDMILNTKDRAVYGATYNDKSVRLFVWRVFPYTAYTSVKGLIVYTSDAESFEYALSKWNERAIIL